MQKIVPSKYVIFLDAFVSTLSSSAPAIRRMFPLGSADYQNVLPGTDPGLGMKRH